jgi:SH3-like domain-containing protein
MREIDLAGRIARRALGGLASLMFAVVLAIGADAQAQAGKDTSTVDSGPEALKSLRYVSLKSDRVYLRQGPGTDYPIAWVFQRAGLPVEVIREFEMPAGRSAGCTAAC